MSINHEERAFRAWPILVEYARKNKTITYKELASALDLHHRSMQWLLDLIQNFCLDNKLPPLTIIAVNKETGKPGNGFSAWDIAGFNEGKKLTFDYDWLQISNPFNCTSGNITIDNLVEELIKTPEKSKEVYSLAKQRGIEQAVFRKSLLKLYKNKCAFCDLSFEAALEASHIIPWPKATREQKIHPSNGILLCSTHHQLFDRHIISIDDSYRLTYSDHKMKNGSYSSVDKIMTVDLHGKYAKTPLDSKHKPSKEYINKRNSSR
ncbi:MAG: HNH endonuclease [Magnetococcales bacterium]|nr:HNH endonuclease [Magnetococcales bacterium]